MEKNLQGQVGFRSPPVPPRKGTLASAEAESAAAAFIAEHRETKDALQAEIAANEGLKIQLRDLMSENEMLRERLTILEHRATFLQGYAVEITTCLDILKNTNTSIIDKALEKARESGIKLVRAPREETAAEVAEGKEVAEIISRLPPVNP